MMMKKYWFKIVSSFPGENIYVAEFPDDMHGDDVYNIAKEMFGEIVEWGVQNEKQEANKNITKNVNEPKVIKKLKCTCGFVGDLLNDGTAISDMADPCDEQVVLHKNKDGTYECLACGAPIYSFLTGEDFWSGLYYIIETFRDQGKSESKGTYGIDRKSITLSKDEWDAINYNFEDLKQAVHDIWVNATKLADDLEEMRLVTDEDSRERFRKVCYNNTLHLRVKLEKFIDDRKIR